MYFSLLLVAWETDADSDALLLCNTNMFTEKLVNSVKTIEERGMQLAFQILPLLHFSTAQFTTSKSTLSNILILDCSRLVNCICRVATFSQPISSEECFTLPLTRTIMVVVAVGGSPANKSDCVWIYYRTTFPMNAYDACIWRLFPNAKYQINNEYLFENYLDVSTLPITTPPNE